MFKQKMFTCVLVLAFLAGCANQHAVFRKNSLPTAPAIVTIDAKQRNILTNKGKGDGEQLRICAEAAPDVYTVLSTSGSFDANVTDAVRAKLGISIAESGASIERTQTINLLRESFYRTCERYLSGAINQEQMVVQAARDQRVMLGVLAIEQLTRTVRPPSTVIIGGATTTSVSGALDEAMAEVDKRVEIEADAKVAHDAAKAEAAKVKPTKVDGVDCEKVKTDDKASKDDKDTCALAATVDGKKAALTKATASREAAERVASSAAGGALAGTGVQAAVSGTTAVSVADAAALAKVADSVVQIVGASNGVQDFLYLCINVLSRPFVQNIDDPKLRVACHRLVGAQVNISADELSREAAAIVEAANAPRNDADTIARGLIGMKPGLTIAAIEAALEKARVQKGSATRHEIVTAFSTPDQTALASAIRQSNANVSDELKKLIPTP